MTRKIWHLFHLYCLQQHRLDRMNRAINRKMKVYRPKICPCCGQPMNRYNYAEEVWNDTEHKP